MKKIVIYSFFMFLLLFARLGPDMDMDMDDAVHPVDDTYEWQMLQG